MECIAANKTAKLALRHGYRLIILYLLLRQPKIIARLTTWVGAIRRAGLSFVMRNRVGEGSHETKGTTVS